MDEVNFFDHMHDQIDRQIRDSKPDEAMRREQLYLQHQILDLMLDTLRLKRGN